MVAAPAFDQCNCTRQRRAVACADVASQGFDVNVGLLLNHALLYNGRATQATGRRRDQRDVAAAAAAAGFSLRQAQTSTGQSSAPIAMEARIAATGRSKNGRMLPSDLISEVTKACSTMVPITMPSTMAATG